MRFEKRFLLLLLLLVDRLEKKKLAKMVSKRKVGKNRGEFGGEEG